MGTYRYKLSSNYNIDIGAVIKAWNLNGYSNLDTHGALHEHQLNSHDENFFYERCWTMEEEVHKQRWKELAKVPRLDFIVETEDGVVLYEHKSKSLEETLLEKKVTIDDVLFKDMSLDQINLFNSTLSNLLNDFKKSLHIIPEVGDLIRGLGYLPSVGLHKIEGLTVTETIKVFTKIPEWYSNHDQSIIYGIVQNVSSVSSAVNGLRVGTEDNSFDVFDILDKDTLEIKSADSKKALAILEKIKDFTKKYQYSGIDTYINEMGEKLIES